MPIDLKPFVRLANRDIGLYPHTDECEKRHKSCAILYLVGALEKAQKRLDEYLAEIERLRAESKQPVCNDFDDYYKSEDIVNYPGGIGIRMPPITSEGQDE